MATQEPTPGRSLAEERLETVVGNLLRAGVLLAGSVVLAGGIYYLCESGSRTADYHTFQGEPYQLRHPLAIVADALALDSRGIIQFGLLLLVATPIARVAFLLLAFLKQRDYLYLLFTAIVLALLLFSFFGRVIG